VFEKHDSLKKLIPTNKCVDDSKNLSVNQKWNIEDKKFICKVFINKFY